MRGDAEAALRDMVEVLQIQLHEGPIGAVRWDFELKITSWNWPASQIFGFTEEEILGQSLPERLAPPDARSLFEEVKRRIRDGEPTVHVVSEHLTKDGRSILCAWITAPVADASGAPVGATSVVQEVTEAVRAKKRNQENETLLTMALEASGAASWQWDRRTSEASFSARFYSMFDLEEGSATPIFEQLIERIHPSDRLVVEPTLRRHLFEGTEFQDVEFRIRSRSGRWRWVSTSTKVVERDGSGEASRLVGSIADVSARKQAQEASREDEQRFTLALEAARVGCWSTDTATGLTHWDSTTSRIFGHDSSFQPTLENTVEAAFAEDRTRDSPLFDVVLNSKARTWDAEYRIVRPNGSIRWVQNHAVVVRDGEGKPVKVIGAILDITERRQAEEALYASLDLARLSDAMSARDVLRFCVDGAERITHSKFAAFYTLEGAGVTIGSVVGSTRSGDQITEALLLPGGEGDREILLECRRKRRPMIFNRADRPFAIESPAGEQLFVHRLISIPVLEGERVVALMCVGNRDSDYAYRDVQMIASLAKNAWLMVQRKRMEEALRASKDAAEAASVSKSQFLANMSHEIRTPMNAILGYSQLLRRERGLTPRQLNYLDVINRSGEHLLALINDVLEMSKIEAGRIEKNAKAFDLRSLLSDLETMFRVRTNDKRLHLSVECVGEIPRRMLVDEGKVRQVMINLLGNAVKFTDQGGIAVRAAARTTSDGTIAVKIEVEDTGCGIEIADQRRIFEAFEQTRMGTRKGGTGLGLTLSRQFARLMDGDITVASKLGKGSVFMFTFPADPIDGGWLSPTPRPRRVERLDPACGEFKILIADDRDTDRELLVEMLGAVGFSVHAVCDGKEALEAFETMKPDLVILDMVMPHVDGCEVARRIKASEVGRATPVVMASASALDDNEARAIQSGADAFLRKPLHEEAVLEAVRKLLKVKYLYADEEAWPRKGDSVPGDLDPDALRRLPDSLRAALVEAVEGGYMDAISEHIDEAERLDPRLGSALRDLAQSFKYDTLLKLLSSDKSQ